MLKAIGMAEIGRIFDVTDSLGISREALLIPLARDGAGSVERMADGRIRIVVPESSDFEQWLRGLGERLTSLPPGHGSQGQGG